MSSTKVLNKWRKQVPLAYNLYMYREKYFFANKKFVAIRTQQFTRENRFLQQRQIWLRCLKIPLCNLF